MTGRSLENLIHAEARRFPHIAAMLEIVEHLSDHDIDTAEVPLPWYRTALRQLRDRARVRAQVAEMNVRAETDLKPFIVDGVTPERPGIQARYTGEECWVDTSNGSLEQRRGWTYLLRTTTLIFFPDAGGVWLNTTFSDFVDPRVRRIDREMRTTLNGYRTAYGKELERNMPGLPIGSTATQYPGVSSIPGVRFF